MGYFRKKPVVIEARQLTNATIKEVYEWVNDEEVRIPHMQAEDAWADYENIVRREGMKMYTLESGKGTQIATIGDWIIKGVQGEFYPCKPDVFEMTYEKV